MHQFKIPNQLLNSKNRPLILAHRGCRALAVENSMDAFRLALEQGADVIETDLRLTKDGVIVCIHDATVNRTSDGNGRVDKLSWSEMAQLRLLGPDGTGKHHRSKIPELSEVLSTLGEETFFALELKSPAFTKAGEVEVLLRMLEDCGAMNRVLIMSFKWQILNLVEAAKTEIPLAHISLFSPWPSPRYPFVGAWWPMFFINPSYVATSHRRGQICCPLDPRPETRVKHYMRMGVDALLSDHPQLTRETIEKHASS